MGIVLSLTHARARRADDIAERIEENVIFPMADGLVSIFQYLGECDGLSVIELALTTVRTHSHSLTATEAILEAIDAAQNCLRNGGARKRE